MWELLASHARLCIGVWRGVVATGHDGATILGKAFSDLSRPVVPGFEGTSTSEERPLLWVD